MNEISSEEWFKNFEDSLWALRQSTAWRERLEQELVELNQRIALLEP